MRQKGRKCYVLARASAAVAALALCVSTATLPGQTLFRDCTLEGGSSNGPDVAIMSYCVPQTLSEIETGTGGTGLGDIICGDGRFKSVTIVDADDPAAPPVSDFSCAVVLTDQPDSDFTPNEPPFGDGFHHCNPDFLGVDRSSMDAAGAALATFASSGGGVLLTPASLGPDNTTGIGTMAQDIAGTGMFSGGVSPYARSAVALITGGAMDITDTDPIASGNQVPPVCTEMLTADLISDTATYTNNRAFRVGALDSANMAQQCGSFAGLAIPTGALAINFDGTVAAFTASAVDLGLNGETSNPQFQNIFRNTLSVLCSSDSMAPITKNVTAAPSLASVNQPIVISALIDDMGAGGSSIASAEYEIRDSDGVLVKSGNSSACPSPLKLCAIDGGFNEVAEDVRVNIEAGVLGAGIYDVCVRGTDSAGNVGDYAQTDPEACAMLVVYDPNGGYVTGSGSIQSAPGSCSICGGSGGKAKIGILSKYKKSGTAPEGHITFEIKGKLDFAADDPDWMVIAGNKAQLKGTGTVNGVGNYGYHIFVTDAKTADTFRIIIWNKNAGNMVVYDNLVEQPTDSGNIVVHK